MYIHYFWDDISHQTVLFLLLLSWTITTCWWNAMENLLGHIIIYSVNYEKESQVGCLEFRPSTVEEKTLSSCCVFWEMTSYPVTYCWWKKSCTTHHVWHPVNNGIFTISTGAGFLPPTVVVIISHKIRIPVMNQSGFYGVHVLLPRCSVIPTISGLVSGDFFMDCTMANYHQTTIWETIFGTFYQAS